MSKWLIVLVASVVIAGSNALLACAPARTGLGAYESNVATTVATIQPTAQVGVPPVIQTAVAQQATAAVQTATAIALAPTTPTPISAAIAPESLVTPMVVVGPGTPVPAGAVQFLVAFPDVPRVTPLEAKDLVDTRQAVLADVRTISEYAQIRLPDAVLFPVGSALGAQAYPLDQVIITYCA